MILVNPFAGQQWRCSWRRKWQPTLVFLSGESHGQRSLAGHGPQGCSESDMTEGTKHMETQTQRTDWWTQRGKERVGRIERTAWKHTHDRMQNRQQVEICCMMQGAQTRCSVTTWLGGGGREDKREGIYVYLWLIHVDVWQKPTQYCKAIFLQLKMNVFLKS